MEFRDEQDWAAGVLRDAAKAWTYQAQFDYRFDFKAQLLPAAGYLVVQPNPRGSNGYGPAELASAFYSVRFGDKDVPAEERRSIDRRLSPPSSSIRRRARSPGSWRGRCIWASAAA